MGIRGAVPGDIVYLAYGHGPKAEVVERLDRTGASKRKRKRGIYYKCKVLESGTYWIEGSSIEHRANTLTRKPA
jgi:hypothetical protein